MSYYWAMDELRKQIDHVDAHIVSLLAKRMSLVKQIGKLKRAEGQALEDKAREEALRSELKKLAAKGGLSAEFVNHLYTHILIESKRIQETSS